jgi:hypothetical protein
VNQGLQHLNIFVYQAYGKIEILQQTLLSVLSLLSSSNGRNDFQILVYTDKKEYFQEFLSESTQILYENLSLDRISQWKGQIQFVHRLKIEMLLHASQARQGRFIYLDGDTYFLSDPMMLFERIDQKNTVMHLPEGKVCELKDPLSKKLRKFLQREHFVLEGTIYNITADVIMWNAGVIGFDASHRALLQQILDLTDQTFGKYQKHVMEQLSVSEILQKNTKVHRSDDVIYHYWNQKDEYQKQIIDFLSAPAEQTSPSWVARFKNFKYPRPPQPKLTIIEKIKLWLD